MTTTRNNSRQVVIIGGGPAGLMAAEVISQSATAGRIAVDVYDAMPSLGRKFLLAGVGGMNITHSEAAPAFASRYGDRQQQVQAWLQEFDADALRAWVHGLGIETFVGSSGRVFPQDMKAAPLLRAWLKRLRGRGVRLHPRQRWLGWNAEGALRFAGTAGEQMVHADALVLALGGGSWSRLGSDGAWVPWLQSRGVQVSPLRPSNCGFEVAAPASSPGDAASSPVEASSSGWGAYFRQHYAGQPVKPVSAWIESPDCQVAPLQGEFVVTAEGVEGSLIYALSAVLRNAIERQGEAILRLDLAPTKSLQQLTQELARPRGKDSLSNHLRKRAAISGVKAGLLRELTIPAQLADPAALAAAIKALPLRLVATRPLDDAISSAGGVCFQALDQRLMLRQIPGVFCAGEMLDWEAPTGGYLLTACFASGRVAGQGVLDWLQEQTPG